MSPTSSQCSDRYIIWLRKESTGKTEIKEELDKCLSDIVNEIVDAYHDEEFVIAVTTPPELVCQNIIKPDLKNLVRLFKGKGRKVTILFLVGGEECRPEGVKYELGMTDVNTVKRMKRENPIYYNPFDKVFKDNTLKQILKDFELTLETQSFWKRKLGVNVVVMHDEVLKTIKTNQDIEWVTRLLWGRNTSAVRRLAAATSLLEHYKIIYFDTVLSTFIKANLLTEDFDNVEKLFEIVGRNVIAIIGRYPPQEPKIVISLMRELATSTGENYKFITVGKSDEDEIDKSIKCIKNLHWALCLGTVYILERFILRIKNNKDKLEYIKDLIEELTEKYELAYRFPIHVFSRIEDFEKTKFTSQEVSTKYNKIFDTLKKEYFNTNVVKFINMIGAKYSNIELNSYGDVLNRIFIEVESEHYYRVNKLTEAFYTQLLQFMSGFRELEVTDVKNWFSQGIKVVYSLAEVRKCLKYFKSDKKDKDITDNIIKFKDRITGEDNLVKKSGEKCAEALEYVKNFMEFVVKI